MEQITEAQEVWNSCLEIIKENVKDQQYITWFKPITPLKVEDQKLVIQVPNQYFFEMIETRFNPIINMAIKNVLGHEAKLTYQVDPSSMESQINNLMIENQISEKRPTISVVEEKPIESNLNPRYTFENFIMGDNNQLARAAAINVANNPGGTSFNPMVLYGDVGLGKTHLIQAIGNEVLRKFKGKRVIYTSSDKFTVDFVDAISENKTNEFSNYYRSMDVLIVDDIQFFAGKEKTQDTFFHTFNTLHQQNKQIILSCDRPPKDLKGIPERLISRFTWGLTADIQPPDLETRIAILKKKSEYMGMEFNSEIIEYIALNITANIRELEGALVGIQAESIIFAKPITFELAKVVIHKNASINSKKSITIDQIQKIVCEHFDISEDLLRDKTRKQEIVIARQVAMYLSKELTKHPLKTIGLQFGGRDHTTVIHAHKCVMDMKSSNEKFKKELDDIRKKIEMTF
jgi:chromosomal replication initiator protein